MKKQNPKHIVFHDKNNKIIAKGSYTNPDHIPSNYSFIVTEEENIRTNKELEIYEEDGVKKVKIKK